MAHWGTFVTTPQASDATASVAVRTEIRNCEAAASKVKLRTSIQDSAGKSVTQASAEASVPAAG